MAVQPVARRSVLADTWGEAIAEFFGTMILVLFGNGSLATFTLFTNIGPKSATTPFANQWILVSLGWGLALMFGIYVAGAVSGGHVNPAVTLAFAARGKFPWRKVGPYILAQVFGAFVAAVILYFIYQGPIVHTMLVTHTTLTNAVGGVFYTGPSPWVGAFGAFCTEFLGTALLVGLIFALVDVRNQPVQANLNPLIIGLVLAAIGISFGLNTGFAVNPARDFGPRLWIALMSGGASFTWYTWIPIVAPIVGGIVGAFIYDFTIARLLTAKGLTKSGDVTAKGASVRETGEPAME